MALAHCLWGRLECAWPWAAAHQRTTVFAPKAMYVMHIVPLWYRIQCVEGSCRYRAVCSYVCEVKTFSFMSYKSYKLAGEAGTDCRSTSEHARWNCTVSW